MKQKVVREIRSIFIIVLIAFTLKATIIEAYIVPTGSMENTIMTGDFLIGSKFLFGMRTPDWIGIPYTDLGFKIPSVQFPKFVEPQPGQVLIFKYPRDTFQKYVKRCVAGPGDTIEVVAKDLFVNQARFELPPAGKFVDTVLPENYHQQEIFLGNQGNRDFFKPLRIPQKGDVIPIDAHTNWKYLLPIILLDGHTAHLRNGEIEYEFTLFDPQDVLRRKKSVRVLDDYYPRGTLLTPWSNIIKQSDFKYLVIDGDPVEDFMEYIVEQDYFWMMGDNRDDSADSRYWGFVPRKYILGEALFAYLSINFKTWMPRFDRIGTVIH